MIFNFLRKYTFPGLKRWFFFAVLGCSAIAFGVALIVNSHPITFIANIIWDIFSFTAAHVPPTVSGIITIIIGGFFLMYAFFRSNKQVLNLVAPDESSLFETLDRYHMAGRGLKIVAIGGGTGLSNMLRGIKAYTSNITAVVAVADDGGSSGRLRETMDIVPPGDIRNCVAALAKDDEVITQLFQYRFADDASPDLRCHSFGNLFLTALVQLQGSNCMSDAVRNACHILKARGEVVPVSDDPMYLIADMEDGSTIHGESNITGANGVIKQLRCKEPAPRVLARVIQAIEDADLVVLGPGSLYTSVIPNLLVPGMSEAIANTHATKVYVCNVMTQPGETSNYKVSHHAEALLKHVGGKQIIDYVLANNSPPRKRQLEKYAKDGQYPVENDLSNIKKLGIEPYPTALIQKGDLVRHNYRKLAKALLEIYIKDQKRLQSQGRARLRQLQKAVRH